MIIATPLGQPPRLLGGAPNFLGLRGDGYSWLGAVPAGFSSQYQAFQQALVALSTALGDPRIHPGATDGILDAGLPSNQAMGALAAAMPHLRPKLGALTTTALSIAFAFGASSTKAKTAVRDYMSTLTQVINAVAALASSSAPSSGGALVLATPWYKTWWGAGGLVLGAVTLVYLISSRRSA